MESQLYGALAVKVRRAMLRSKGPFGLESLRKGDEILSIRDLALAYCRDLRELLQIEDLRVLAAALLEVEQRLNNLLHERELEESSKEIPDLTECYRALAPVLLRALIEANDEVEPAWREAIRIGVEEEIYHWQDLFAFIDEELDGSAV
jgi:hypothetical protein